MLFFALSSRWPRDLVKMKGFELAAISVAPSDFHNFFEVATGPCKNAVNLAGGPFLSSLFSLLSSLFSLLSSLFPLRDRPFSAPCRRPRASRKPCQLSCCCSKLERFLFSLLSSLFSLLSALFSLLSSLSSRLSSLIPLCSLPSSLFSLCSLPSSLAAAHFSDRTSHFSLRTLHQAIPSASNPLDPVPHHPLPGGMREAIK